LKISRALISVFHKEGLNRIIPILSENNIDIISTGGTLKYIQELGFEVSSVEAETGYPSILGGRVKTLHPKVFGGILNRRDVSIDQDEMSDHGLTSIDLVIVDLYPFEKTLEETDKEIELIEKIDIGGIALIRAGAKNFKDVVVISSRNQYAYLEKKLVEKENFSIKDRKNLAAEAFVRSAHYDELIASYLSAEKGSLRYGENPHQKATFLGNYEEVFEKLNGKAISYNNLLDVDAALNLHNSLKNYPCYFSIFKHNNACGVAVRQNLVQAYKDALAGDPISSFGGILMTNKPINREVAEQINQLFYEILIAPDFESDALELLVKKKNRIILRLKDYELPKRIKRSAINGLLIQAADSKELKADELNFQTEQLATAQELNDLLIANALVKNTKSNAIVLVKDGQLIGHGTGQTSRVDALKQAISKAQKFDFDLTGSVLASDAFFPFPDCVEIAGQHGITSIIQPGGSKNDQLSIDKAEEMKISLAFTGFRHFKH
tara:strand:- start:20412 stop:21893 length:1482 start_codon:yes stop_codon:yes gene_type:complete